MAQHVHDRLTAFIHGEVDAAELRAIEQHLDECDACRDRLVELERTDAIVAGLIADVTAVDAPDDLWEEIRRGLDDARAPRQRSLSTGVAAAALVLLALAIGILVERWAPVDDAGSNVLDMHAYLSAVEAQPHHDDSRELGLLPAGFEKLDPVEALRAAGLGHTAEDVPTADSQFHGARVLELGGGPVYQLIFSNDAGPYILFVAAETIEPDFADRALGHFFDVSSTCARVASDRLSIFWDAGGNRQWILVGRDHPDAFYTEVMRSVATTQQTDVEAAFGWIQGLAGRWQGSFAWSGELSGGDEIEMQFFPTGLDSAMVENHSTDGRRSMSSVYHIDAERLVMTHFCTQNQPRMEAGVIDTANRAIRFDFLDITDHVPSEGHVDGLDMQLANERSIVLLYRYVHDGKRSVERIELTRVTD